MKTMVIAALAASLALIGCTAGDQQIAIQAGNAAACGWLASTGGARQCGGSSQDRLGALTERQREEIVAIAARAAQVDPNATEIALASLESTAATLRLVTERLIKIAEGKPASASPPVTPSIAP